MNTEEARQSMFRHIMWYDTLGKTNVQVWVERARVRGGIGWMDNIKVCTRKGLLDLFCMVQDRQGLRNFATLC